MKAFTFASLTQRLLIGMTVAFILFLLSSIQYLLWSNHQLRAFALTQNELNMNKAGYTMMVNGTKIEGYETTSEKFEDRIVMTTTWKEWWGENYSVSLTAGL